MREQSITGERRYFVSNELLVGLLHNLLALELQANDYAPAERRAHELLDMDIDAELKGRLGRLLHEIEKIRNQNSAYAVAGKIDESARWHHTLFKRQFEFDLKSGDIAEFKLRCEKKFVGVVFDATLTYSLEPDAGSCELEVIGDPGSEFDLVLR